MVFNHQPAATVRSDSRLTDQLFGKSVEMPAQNAAEIWRGSNSAARREILNAVCLNRTLSNVSLDATKRKPFDVFAKQPEIENSRAERI